MAKANPTMLDFQVPEYESCMACPKKCGVNRNKGETGFCKETSDLRIAWAGLHFGEEPPITGAGGSGAIFITGCNLGCVFCQNYQIAREGMGKAVSLQEFTDICLKLQAHGAENINIVTGSHAMPAIAKGLRNAKKNGLNIPVVWNSSAYESEECIADMADCVDGWLPDLKTLNCSVSNEIFRTKDYPEYATKAILQMFSQSPLLIEYSDEEKYPFCKLYSGLIVRHLALPARLQDSKAVLKWFADNLKGKALLSLMTQYTPIKKERKFELFENRMLKVAEDKKLRSMLKVMDIDDGFYQELVPSDDWLPDFNIVKTFSSELATPLWHWTF